MTLCFVYIVFTALHCTSFHKIIFIVVSLIFVKERACTLRMRNYDHRAGPTMASLLRAANRRPMVKVMFVSALLHKTACIVQQLHSQAIH